LRLSLAWLWQGQIGATRKILTQHLLGFRLTRAARDSRGSQSGRRPWRPMSGAGDRQALYLCPRSATGKARWAIAAIADQRRTTLSVLVRNLDQHHVGANGLTSVCNITIP